MIVAGKSFGNKPESMRGRRILIDAIARVMELKISEEEINRRRAAWSEPPLKFTKGTLYKYAKCVSSASEGCVTDA